jgi:hypothetical protein
MAAGYGIERKLISAITEKKKKRLVGSLMESSDVNQPSRPMLTAG